MNDARIPTLDIRSFDTDPTAFAKALGDAYRSWGFCGIRGHGLDAQMLDEAYAQSARFFALSQQEKHALHHPEHGNARGYTGMGVETAVGATQADLKEFFHVGRVLAQDAPYRDIMPDNVWPQALPAFQTACLSLYQALDGLGRRVLEAIALDLSLPKNWFDERVNLGNSILRLIHYPPCSNQDQAGAVRAAAHEDINVITLLVGASADGLQVQHRNGDWVPFTADADTIVVNIGDMLQRLTNHAYRSTTHRVVNPETAQSHLPRFSMPFFLHFNPDVLIETLPSCVSEAETNRYPEPITANDYLRQRLMDIGLLKEVPQNGLRK